jgi:hypothetical protein
MTNKEEWLHFSVHVRAQQTAVAEGADADEVEFESDEVSNQIVRLIEEADPGELETEEANYEIMEWNAEPQDV